MTIGGGWVSIALTYKALRQIVFFPKYNTDHVCYTIGKVIQQYSIVNDINK